MVVLRRLLVGLALLIAGVFAAAPQYSVGPISAVDAVVDSIAPQAQALTPSQRIILKRGISPVASWSAATDPFPSAILSHSRTSLATMFDSTGKLTYAPNNLLTQSNTFSNAAWTKATVTVAGGFTDPLGGSNATRLTATGATSYVYQFGAVPTGTNALTSIWVRRVSGSGTINLWTIIGYTGTAIVPTSTWTQYYVAGAVSSGSAAFAGVIIQTSGDVIEVYAATASAVTYETSPRTADQVITTSSAYYGPRIDYDPNTLAVKGLLIEGEPRTNLQPVSDLSASTTLNATTVVTGQAAPDGTNGARKIIADTTAGYHYATQALATTSGVLYSTSFFAYAPDAGYTLVGGASNTGVFGTFDLATGTATSAANMAASMRQVGTLAGKPVYKCVWQWTAAANNNQAYFYAPNALNTIAPSAGNGTSGVVIWGVQTEAGANDTSLIVSRGSAVTRAPDIVTLTGPAIAAASSSAATLISEWDAINAPPVVSAPTQFGTTGGYPLLRINNATTLLAMSTAGNSASLTVASGTWNANFRVGLAYNSSGFTLAANGASASSAAAFTSPSTVYVGNLNGVANYSGNHHLRSFAIYNQRLPDATLKAKTVVGAPYAANDNANPFAPQFAANDNLPVHWRIAL